MSRIETYSSNKLKSPFYDNVKRAFSESDPTQVQNSNSFLEDLRRLNQLKITANSKVMQQKKTINIKFNSNRLNRKRLFSFISLQHTNEEIKIQSLLIL